MSPPRPDRPIETLTLDEALAERAQLVQDVQDIQTSLGDKNRVGRDGERMSSFEYQEWRSRAMFALRHRQRRMAALKTHIQAKRQASLVAISGVDDQSDRGLLRRAYGLLRRLASEDVEFDPDEQALMDLIQANLQG